MSTTKSAQTRTALAATAAVFVLMVPWRGGSLVNVGLGEASNQVITTGRRSHDADGRPREAVPPVKAPVKDIAAARVQSPPVEAMQATPRDPMNRGYSMGLGDVLFTSGRYDLKPAAIGNLNRLVSFLAEHHKHSASIQGYTDSVGDQENNQELSERRANSVKAYLVAQGIESTRLLAVGKGQNDPLAGNDSRAGRQQNRRAEVIIKNPPAALPQRPRTERVMVLLMLLQSVSGSEGRPFQ